ncbi:MAG: RidA family protein [Christensenellaceae bacterium]
MSVYKNLENLGLLLPTPPAKGGLYTPAKRFGKNLVYVSGCGPAIDAPVSGKLGESFHVAAGQVHARNAMLNVLSVLEQEIGDLNQVQTIAKLLVFVASTDNFYNQPDVANGASELLADLFGAEALPARSAIGVNVLPNNIPVEIEALFEIKGEASCD